jgi:hypothetical protein
MRTLNYFKIILKNIFFKNIKIKYIYHHLGLGDHIILNALVREIIHQNSKNFLILFVKKNNISSVKFMLKDINNINFFLINNDDEVEFFLRNINKKNIIKIGFNNVTPDFDKYFYNQYNIHFSKRFNKDILNRNLESENDLFNSLGLENKEYVFIHDDKNRNLSIDEQYIPHLNNQIIIRPFITNTIFDWCKVIENAKEVHCICSSFKALVDSLQPPKPLLYYYHKVPNTNKSRNETYTTSILPWKII